MTLALNVVAAALACAFLALALESRREHESVALRRALMLAVGAPLPYLAAAWLPLPGAVGLVLLAATIVFAISLVVPGRRPGGAALAPELRLEDRLDERTVMFSRAALAPGDERYERYYADHPEHRAPDDRFRSKPGLLSPRATKADPLGFAAADASFTAVARLADLVEGETAPEAVAIAPDRATRFVKGWAAKLGAVACGVTELRDEHLYAVKGRGPRWGEAIERRHRWAVVVAVEMDHRQVAAAPAAPIVMESAQQYLESGAIAVQLAEAIRRLGRPATAHIDANYEVLCTRAARDAGLGEIGRLGLLMTPRLGPRVRLAVVTTDLELLPDGPGHDPTVLDFCSICEKCADACPAEAIAAGPRVDDEGRLRWRIDQEACFTYWCSVGTDCGRCVSVCPYSHPDTPLHALVRTGLSRNGWTRRVALFMDDVLYGRRPEPKPPSDWLRD